MNIHRSVQYYDGDTHCRVFVTEFPCGLSSYRNTGSLRMSACAEKCVSDGSGIVGCNTVFWGVWFPTFGRFEAVASNFGRPASSATNVVRTSNIVKFVHVVIQFYALKFCSNVCITLG